MIETGYSSLAQGAKVIKSAVIAALIMPAALVSQTAHAERTTGVKQPFAFYTERGVYFNKQVELNLKMAAILGSKKKSKQACEKASIAADNAYYHSVISADAKTFYTTGPEAEIAQLLTEQSELLLVEVASGMKAHCPAGGG
jgi:hypothetical protein